MIRIESKDLLVSQEILGRFKNVSDTYAPASDDAIAQ
jgi:hypothetical protein